MTSARRKPMGVTYMLSLLCLCAGASAQQSSGSSSPEGSHTVRPGETLWGISGRYTGQPPKWTGLQQRNRIVEPRALQVGQVLQLDKPYATVVAATADVRANAATHLLVAGDRVLEGDIVRTGPDSFVTLQMPDGSRVTLPSNSALRLVRFYAADGRASVQVQLDAGDVEARVPLIKKRQDRTWEVRTRIAIVGVRGTRFRVSLPNDASEAVSVLQSAVTVNSLGHGILYVPEAKGVVARAGESGGAVLDLLPAPLWLDHRETQDLPRIQLGWTAVEGATNYRVQVARDAGFTDVVGEQRLVASGGREVVFFDGIAVGSYFARVTAIDADGLEGLESIASFVRTHMAPLVGTTRWMSDSGELEFSWPPLSGAVYALEVADNSTFDRFVVRQEGLSSNTVHVQALSPGRYWWRVKADIVRSGQRAEVVGALTPLTVEGAR